MPLYWNTTPPRMVEITSEEQCVDTSETAEDDPLGNHVVQRHGAAKHHVLFQATESPVVGDRNPFRAKTDQSEAVDAGTGGDNPFTFGSNRSAFSIDSLGVRPNREQREDHLPAGDVPHGTRGHHHRGQTRGRVAPYPGVRQDQRTHAACSASQCAALKQRLRLVLIDRIGEGHVLHEWQI